MPATSVRDLVVKGCDLVAGTHGRGFFVLDDVTPLRQLEERALAAPAWLFAPQTAIRFRSNKNTDTPLPPDEPSAANPPDGAVIDYALERKAGRVTLEVADAEGRLVRRYASDDPPEAPVPGRNIPDYWIRPPQPLSAEAGLHRFVWDLHHAVPDAASFSYPIAATFRNTPREPRGPWALPGRYTVRLQVDGQELVQPLELVMDPRVATPAADLALQHALAVRLAEAMGRSKRALAALRRPQAADAEGGAEEKPGADGAAALTRTSRQLAQLYAIVEEADAAPTPAVQSAAEEALAGLDAQAAALGTRRQKGRTP